MGSLASRRAIALDYEVMHDPELRETVAEALVEMGLEDFYFDDRWQRTSFVNAKKDLMGEDYLEFLARLEARLSRDGINGGYSLKPFNETHEKYLVKVLVKREKWCQAMDFLKDAGFKNLSRSLLSKESVISAIYETYHPWVYSPKQKSHIRQHEIILSDMIRKYGLAEAAQSQQYSKAKELRNLFGGVETLPEVREISLSS